MPNSDCLGGGGGLEGGSRGTHEQSQKPYKPRNSISPTNPKPQSRYLTIIYLGPENLM